LGDFENIEQRLRGDALDAIIADFAAHAFQRQPPWINILHSYFGLRFLQFTEPRHNGALAIIVFGLDPTGKPKAATLTSVTW
jgi:hypothetical protein